jgi:hypothetical protein
MLWHEWEYACTALILLMICKYVLYRTIKERGLLHNPDDDYLLEKDGGCIVCCMICISFN